MRATDAMAINETDTYPIRGTDVQNGNYYTIKFYFTLPGNPYQVGCKLLTENRDCLIYGTLQDPDQLVVPLESVKLLIDEPLLRPFTHRLDARTSAGFTRIDILRAIFTLYDYVYKQEDLTRSSEYVNDHSDGCFGIYKDKAHVSPLHSQHMFATNDSDGTFCSCLPNDVCSKE